jgi:predicted SAM-dependent methyltransferase
LCQRLPAGGKLHVACGPLHLSGWINIDKFPTPATDYVVDVRYGLPFRELSFIFAEHFLEHLALDEAIEFLRAARGALGPRGVLRLSTPNLNWVYRTHYGINTWRTAEDAERDCLQLNRAFHGWGHRFLYNLSMLTAVLQHAGFTTVTPTKYGDSAHHELRDLERHERSEDLPDESHILIVEAEGEQRPLALSPDIAAYLTAYHAR